MQTILVTGGTGLVGKTLIPFLTQKGYKTIILTRNVSDKTPTEHTSYAHWDVKKQTIDITAIQQADFIIHLAGAGVMDEKWTEKYKKEILDSRVKSSELLVNSLAANKNEVKAIVSSSAIGWYGEDDQKGKAFTEDDPAATDFLGETCKAWEESITAAEQLNIRVVKIRTGIVLDNNGGALSEFTKPVKFGIATILGSGTQMVSWIHIEDHCRILLLAIEHTNMTGSYNSVSPEPVSNKVLVTTVANVMKGNLFVGVPVPTIFLKLILGQRSIEILKSCTVSSTKIKSTGFNFIFPSIKAALNNLLNK